MDVKNNKDFNLKNPLENSMKGDEIEKKGTENPDYSVPE